MTIPSSGPIKLSGDLKRTFGGDNNPSLGEYYKDRVNFEGVPVRGSPISFSSFRNVVFSPLEVITYTGAEVQWTPKLKNAKNMYVYVIGGGGSGGVANAQSSGGIFGIDGAAAASGAGAGGVAYVKFPRGYIPNSARIYAGPGAPGASQSGENTGKAGTNGAQSYFLANRYEFSSPRNSNFTIAGNGGRGGGAAWQSDAGETTASTDGLSGTGGGTAFISNTSNIPNVESGLFTGGSGGTARASGSNVVRAAGGGGAPAFLAAHDNVNDGSKGSNSAAAGAKVSDYVSFPFILEDYLTNAGFSTVRSLYSFNGSDGAFSTAGNAPGYGGGSGGTVWQNGGTVTSAAGGDGIILIVYEI